MKRLYGNILYIMICCFQKMKKDIDLHYAPFKRYAKESPGRIGYYIGYKIVNSYMNNMKIDYNQLMLFKDSREFLKKSQYKPKVKNMKQSQI